jgi:hypothetical protein
MRPAPEEPLPIGRTHGLGCGHQQFAGGVDFHEGRLSIWALTGMLAMPPEYPLPEDAPPLALGPVPDRFPSSFRVRGTELKEPLMSAPERLQ